VKGDPPLDGRIAVSCIRAIIKGIVHPKMKIISSFTC